MSVIIASDLVKHFGMVEAVQGINLEVHPGECYGLLGPNGAGKTTTLSMIRCILPPTSGQLKVLGREAGRFGRTIRQRLGVVTQQDTLDPDLSVRENLIVYASYFGIRAREARGRSDELLAFMALDKKMDVRIEELSGGLRRRLMLARALISNPELLVLDEPTTGLDPQSRHHLWQRLRTLKSQGVGMILSTHTMDEAEFLCDRLSIIDYGLIIETGTPQELITRHAGEEVVELFGLRDRDPAALERLLKQTDRESCRFEQYQDSVYGFTPAGTSFPGSFLQEARREGFQLTVRKGSLGDVFLTLTGRELRE